MLTDLLLIAAGLALLAVSGQKLVDFAVALAEKARLTPAVIGLTIVAAGTSMPEAFVSFAAALRGLPEIAVANVVGSNIANVGLILGACALFTPLPIGSSQLRLEYPFALLASWIALLLCRDGQLDRLEGAFFVASVIAFMSYSIWLARSQVSPAERDRIAESLPDRAHVLGHRSTALLVAGLIATFAGLGVGADLLVKGASGIARLAGLSERVIGLTLVAVGTSLPELVASLAAAAKRHVGMAIANVIGSNIFNLLFILGGTGLIRPVPVAPAIVSPDMWVMLGLAAGLFPLVARDRSLGRGDGAILLGAYATYVLIVLGAR
jgi:cation:H+ antiporter